MRSRLARSGTAAIGLAALLATTTPPAHADTAFSAAFVGTAAVSSGLGLPCAQATNPDLSLTLCPQAALESGGPLLGILSLRGTYGVVPNGHIDLHHNTQPLAFGSTVCLGAEVNVLKASKPPVGAGLCSITAAGTVAGWCNLSSGQGAGVLSGVGWRYQEIYFSFHFNSAGLIVMTGHYTKENDPSNHGKLFGFFLAIPFPNPLVLPNPPHIANNNCSNRSANHFTMVGVLYGIPDPLL